MSVPVSVVKKINPLKPDEPCKFYGAAQVSDEINFDELCEMASDGCTITQADISAAFYAVEKAAVKCLKKGQVIRLGNLGSIQVLVRSKGAESKEGYHVSLVKSARTRFVPGKALKNCLKTLEYRIVPQRATAKKDDEPETDENGYINL